MSLDKLFESIDKNIFTPELKKEINDKFNEAVETKAYEKIQERTEEYEEKHKEYIAFLDEEFKKSVISEKEKISEKVKGYLDLAVDNFLDEVKDTLEESKDVEKAKLVIEAFDTMLVATGVKISDIVESKDKTSVENKLSEQVSKYNTLAEENIKLKKENDELIRMGVVSQVKESLSIVEAEKFEKLVECVTFTDPESYTKTLENIKQSVSGNAGNAESVNEQSLNETAKKNEIGKPEQKPTHNNTRSFRSLI